MKRAAITSLLMSSLAMAQDLKDFQNGDVTDSASSGKFLKPEYGDDDIEMYSKDEIGDYPCYFYDGEQLFDLRPLRNFEDDWFVQARDGSMIYFNLCKLVN